MPEYNSHNNQYKKNLEQLGINPSKKLGQNFIFDKNILNKITSLINPDACDLVIEIGPGLGGLSEALLNNNVKKILLVEKDRQFTQLLNALKSKYPDQIDIIFEDAINFNFDIENYKHHFNDMPFVNVCSDPPRLKEVRGTNNCNIFIQKLPKKTDLINYRVISIIDNLVKGAAGQAVQNMNIMFNFDETLGLNNMALYP